MRNKKAKINFNLIMGIYIFLCVCFVVIMLFFPIVDKIETKSFDGKIVICENVPTFDEEGVWKVTYLANGTCIFEKEETEIIRLK